MKVAIINIGANRKSQNGHGLISPLFEDDGSFVYVPVEERGYDAVPNCPTLPTYGELFSNNQKVLRLIPKSSRNLRAHDDPEFESFTYGDYPNRIVPTKGIPKAIGRAGNLKRLEEGDLLFFLARLNKVGQSTAPTEAGFYLIGFFEISVIRKDVKAKPTESELQIFGKNAHVRRGLSDPSRFDNFWVFKGSDESRLFLHPVPFDRELASKTLRNKEGEVLTWPPKFTGLQRIASYTRSCRLIEDKVRVKVLLEQILELNEIPLFRRLLGLNPLT
jgi:hypothetical protein